MLPISNLRVILTARCSLSCFFCYREGMTQGQTGDMTLSDALMIVKYFADLGIRKIRLTGGEPLLWEHLFDLLKALKAVRQINRIAITTNGVMLEDKVALLYELGVTDLSVSLRALAGEPYKQMTGTDCLNDVLAGIEVSAKYRFLTKRINFVYTKSHSMADFLNVLDLAGSRNMVLRVIDVVMCKEAYTSLDPIESLVSQRSIQHYNIKHNIVRYRLAKNGGVVDIDRNPCNAALAGKKNACVYCARDYAPRVTPMGLLKPCILKNDDLLDLMGAIKNSSDNREFESVFNKAMIIRGPLIRGWKFKENELWGTKIR